MQSDQSYTGNNLEFANAPNLREVMVNSITIGLIDFKLPWSQLRSLAFQGLNTIKNDGLYVADCLQVLSQCSNLVDLKVFDCDLFGWCISDSLARYSNYTREKRVVTIPRLRNLICATEDHRIIYGVLLRLHLPSFRSLRLSIGDQSTLDAIIQPIIAARPPLRVLVQVVDANRPSTLAFTGSDRASSSAGNFDILAALEAFPDLVSYYTNITTALRDLFYFYSPTSDDRAFGAVPDLQELCLFIDKALYDDRYFLSCLRTFVSSRWYRHDLAQRADIRKISRSPFRRIRLEGLFRHNSLTGRDYRDLILRCLKNEGLELELYDHGMSSVVWKAGGARWPCEV